jgi:FixJ family two-component response regulator
MAGQFFRSALKHLTMKSSCKVFIIDDDFAVRRGLSLLFKAAGFLVESFESAEKLLEMDTSHGEGCIILDIFMEGKTGLELQGKIREKFPCLPIIFLSGKGDIPMSVKAMKEGAVNFLEKPVDDNLLVKAVEDAMQLSHNLLVQRQSEKLVRERINTLTPREFEIFQMIITGMLNKQIAGQLNIAEHTVKLHRGKITQKLGAKSVAELVRIADNLNLHS